MSHEPIRHLKLQFHHTSPTPNLALYHPMKAPILFARPSILAAGSALLGTGLIVLSPITAQDQAPIATPAATPAPALAPAPTPEIEPALPVDPAAAALPAPAPVPTPAPGSTTPPPPADPSAAGAGLPPAAPTPRLRSFAGTAGTTPSSSPTSPGGIPGAGSPDERMRYTPEVPAPPTITTVRARFAPATLAGADAYNRPGATTVAVADLILAEEVHGSADETARHYETVVADFDSRRAGAAQAIFRLAENYRKAGRVDEARIQYARILREFVDFPELVTLSQRQLTQGLPRQMAGGGAPAHSSGSSRPSASSAQDHGEWARATARATEEERLLLLEEIALLQSQVAQTKDLIASGQAPATSAMPLLREILQLKRQLVRTAVPEAAPKAASDDHSEGGGDSTSGEGLLTPPAPEVPRAQEILSR